VKALHRWPVAQVARIVSAAVVSVVALTALASPSGAASTQMACTAFVFNLPHPYSLVVIDVSTKPGAKVSATESAQGRSWSMSPGTTANASGHAGLTQKVAAVRKYELVRVSVNVTLGALSGHCSTHYTPPSLPARI
jgi:hypothetical protein